MIQNFPSNEPLPTGRKPRCLCGNCPLCRMRTYTREWYRQKSKEERRQVVLARNPEQTRAADRARYQRDKDVRVELVKNYVERYPEKRAAHSAVSNAIRDGRLVRQGCSICGNPKSHGHHEDYSRPLAVTWLCQRHHTDRHIEIAAQQAMSK